MVLSSTSREVDWTSPMHRLFAQAVWALSIVVAADLMSVRITLAWFEMGHFLILDGLDGGSNQLILDSLSGNPMTRSTGARGNTLIMQLSRVPLDRKRGGFTHLQWREWPSGLGTPYINGGPTFSTGRQSRLVLLAPPPSPPLQSGFRAPLQLFLPPPPPPT